MAKEASNQYTSTKANDAGADLVQIVIEYYRGRRGQFTNTEATNIGTEITAILNGSHKV